MQRREVTTFRMKSTTSRCSGSVRYVRRPATSSWVVSNNICTGSVEVGRKWRDTSMSFRPARPRRLSSLSTMRRALVSALLPSASSFIVHHTQCLIMTRSCAVRVGAWQTIARAPQKNKRKPGRRRPGLPDTDFASTQVDMPACFLLRNRGAAGFSRPRTGAACAY